MAFVRNIFSHPKAHLILWITFFIAVPEVLIASGMALNPAAHELSVAQA